MCICLLPGLRGRDRVFIGPAYADAQAGVDQLPLRLLCFLAIHGDLASPIDEIVCGRAFLVDERLPLPAHPSTRLPFDAYSESNAAGAQKPCWSPPLCKQSRAESDPLSIDLRAMGAQCLVASSAPTARDRWDASSQQRHAHRQCADPAPASRRCSTTYDAARTALATRRDALASIAAALTSLSIGPASANSRLRDYLQSRQRIYALAPIYSSEQRLAVIFQLMTGLYFEPRYQLLKCCRTLAAGDASAAQRSTGRGGDASGTAGSPEGLHELLHVRGQ